MKALVSVLALFTFVAGTVLPVESYAQTSGAGQTMAPDTSTPAAPAKKKKSSKSHHAKKKTKKSSTAQTSSAKPKHSRHSVG
jgi:Ni/Co efflux regulator RcnB